MRFFASGSTSKTVPATGVVQFKLTDVGEGIAECELIRWYVKEGDRIKQFDKVCEVQSDKANVEITSRYDGVVKKLYAEKGQLVKVGAPLIDIDVGGSSSAAAAPVASASTPSVSQAAPTPAPHPPPVALPDAASAAVTSTANDKVLATPAVRRIAREHNVNLQKVRGSGRDGRVMKEDILAFLEASSAAPTATSAAAAPSVPVRVPAAAAAARTHSLSRAIDRYVGQRRGALAGAWADAHDGEDHDRLRRHPPARLLRRGVPTLPSSPRTMHKLSLSLSLMHLHVVCVCGS